MVEGSPVWAGPRHQPPRGAPGPPKHFALRCPALPCPALPCPTLPCPALPCPAAALAACPALPAAALPALPALLPCFALPCPAKKVVVFFHVYQSVGTEGMSPKP